MKDHIEGRQKLTVWNNCRLNTSAKCVDCDRMITVSIISWLACFTSSILVRPSTGFQRLLFCHRLQCFFSLLLDVIDDQFHQTPRRPTDSSPVQWGFSNKNPEFLTGNFVDRLDLLWDNSKLRLNSFLCCFERIFDDLLNVPLRQEAFRLVIIVIEEKCFP